MALILMHKATVWLGYQLPNGTWATSHALLTKGDRIIATGESALAAEADTVVDCGGGFLMPGFADGHIHTIFGGLESEFAPVRHFETPQEIAQSVGAWAKEHPDQDWIRGEGFDHTIVDGGVFHAAWLDEYVPDRPVFLRATDYHTVWVNSVALERAGYQAEISQPHDGEIVLDDSGKPIGTLREWGAWLPVYELIPQPDHETKIAGLKFATESCAAAGLTWVQEAWVDLADIDVWKRAHSESALAVDVDLALWADSNSWRDQLPEFLAVQQSIRDLATAQLTCNTVKFFADGVVESGTGALLEPYCDCPHSRGMPNWDPEELKLAVAAVDAAGFTAHIHAIGDHGIRMALDAMEHTALVNPPRDRRWVIAHVQLIDRKDVQRFVDLGAIANFEPYWSRYDSWQEKLTAPRLGPERTNRQYQTATLANTGANISFGSDWPVSSFAPLDGISVAVTRQMTVDSDPWMPEERVSVDFAFHAYTTGVAFQGNRPDAGVIRPGALANLVLLDQDPRQVPPTSINAIKVLSTWRRGHKTYGG